MREAYRFHPKKVTNAVFEPGQCSVGRVGCRVVRRCGFAIVAVLMGVLVAGCVKTAECDEHVSCGSGEVCYQHQCMVRCERREQCAEDEVCASCQGDSQNPAGYCHGVRGGACVLAESGEALSGSP